MGRAGGYSVPLRSVSAVLLWPAPSAMLRRSLGRAVAAGLRSRHASFAAASALARCAVGARTLALLLVVGYAAPQKLALCLQLPQPKLRERKLGKKERLNIVLVGKTGHGKSSLANILCGDKSKFPVSDDLSRSSSESVALSLNPAPSPAPSPEP